jgi:hypothetical protein
LDKYDPNRALSDSRRLFFLTVIIFIQFTFEYGDYVYIRKLSLGLFALMLLGLGVPLVAAQSAGIQYQHSAGIVTLTTEDIDIKVTGVNQAPHFHWWDPNNPTVDYHVMFVKLFEANDTNSDGIFDLGSDSMVGPHFALPTIGWDFSGFEIEQEGGNVTAVHYNFTSTTTHDPRPTGSGENYGHLPSLPTFDVMIEIRVHIDLENPGEFKFDLVIDGWEWTYDDSILVLQFTVTESSHGQNQGDQDPTNFGHTGTQFSFGNGYMQYEPTALAAQNTLEVKASYGEGTGLEAGESVYLAFENFGNETMEYDPILGIEPSTSDSLTTTLLLVGGVVLVIFVAVLVVRSRK